MNGAAACLLVVALLSGTAARAVQQDSAGPNINLLRQASGHYVYRALSDGRERGTEDFQMLVHRDGSRTLMMWHDLWARDAQFTVVLRVAENFRPLTAFASYWVANGYKGNTTFRVDGNTLTATGVSNDGPIAQTMEVPDRFSIGTHPVAGDGWHLWYAAGKGAINLYSLEATADLAKPILGQLVEMPYEVLGEEVIETPAGKFDTTRYRLMGATDVWVTGPDRLLVRMVMERFDREYLLTRFQQSAPRP
jgi:hypothetical protein